LYDGGIMTFENISASYDIGIAKEYGIPSAVLLNKLMYLAKFTTREDGFCWRSAKELEEELGLTRRQQDLAIKKLEEAGLIETKNTYIIGTQIKCKHFKLLFDFDKSGKCEVDKMYKCDFNKMYKPVNNNKTIIKDNNNIYKEAKKAFGSFKRIKLSEKEYNKLIEDYGKEFIDKQIELLDEYIESNNNKNKYTNFNLVLRKSIRDNWFTKNKYKKETEVPGWFGKEIKNEMSEESKRIYEELTRNNKQ
jgi:hypothetical protein